MGRHHSHLGQSDRDRIQALRDAGHGIREIGRVLEVSHATVSRELSRNAVRVRKRGSPGAPGIRYRASSAHAKARARRRHARKDAKKLRKDPELRAYVLSGLGKGWSPEGISGRMRREGRPFYASKAAIYGWLYSAWGQRYCPLLPSGRFSRRKRRKKKAGRAMIPSRKPLSLRPRGARNRSRYGHWEADAVVSGRNSGGRAALVVATERRSRLVDARLVPRLSPSAASAALSDIFRERKALTVAMDNGQENRNHLDLRKEGTDTFFCDPHSPWQKGSVEHANGMLRLYVPKGCDIGTFSQEDIDRFVARINEKPRKILGFASATEVAQRGRVIVGPAHPSETAGGAFRG